MGNIRGDLEQEPTGEFKERYATSDVLQLLDDAHPEPMAAPEISEEIGMSRRTAGNKLRDLVEDGHVQTKKIGARSRVYWVACRS